MSKVRAQVSPLVEIRVELPLGVSLKATGASEGLSDSSLFGRVFGSPMMSRMLQAQGEIEVQGLGSVVLNLTVPRSEVPALAATLQELIVELRKNE